VKKQLMILGLLMGLMMAMVPGVASAAKATVKPKDDCKNGGWVALGFASQKDCTGVVKAGDTPIFAIAYTNLDGTPGYDAGQDVLIAKLIDGNGNGTLEAGDLVVMGQYPTTFTPTGAADFSPFGGASIYAVEQVTVYPTPGVLVRSAGGQIHFWTNNYESQYYQGVGFVYDLVSWHQGCACVDEIQVGALDLTGGDPRTEIDDPFIDVDLSLPT
jgi:hypothetical protein